MGLIFIILGKGKFYHVDGDIFEGDIFINLSKIKI